MGAPNARQFKPGVRVMGVAEGPFSWEDKQVLLVGVVVRLLGYIETIRTTRVEVDGADANAKVTKLALACRSKASLAAILLKGVSLAGFNIIDGAELSQQVNMPVVTVCRAKPDLKAMKRALEKHFPDWAERFALIEAGNPREVENGDYTIYAKGFGINRVQTRQLLNRATINSALPEPIRLARRIARAMATI